MSLINWDRFLNLPGAATTNFEKLCRALIRRNYGRYGQLLALANQPGVEFHLKLDAPCGLGSPPRWFGWQCRWYDLPGGRAIGNARREKIKQAIKKTEKVLPCLTDWVLWTRRALTESDQEWFKSIQSQFQLTLWTENEVEDLSTDDAEIVRETYFGELILTPERLAELHAIAVAPLSKRWQPQVHQSLSAERTLRRILLEPKDWSVLPEVARRLRGYGHEIAAGEQEVPASLRDGLGSAVSLCAVQADELETLYGAIVNGDLAQLQQQLSTPSAPPEAGVVRLVRRLRSANIAASLTMTNAMANIRLARKATADLRGAVDQHVIGVVADFGCGKTQLSAELTAPTQERPAGVLLHGQKLRARSTLDDLAHQIVLRGSPLQSMEALVAAVDAAGERAKCRLPIFIDGLNEAEDPRDWKDPLASLNKTLVKYPHVLVVCTVRHAYADESLPSETSRIEIPGFDTDTAEAVRRYFRHYKIQPGEADLPWELLSHPLTLRLFCEVTNPKRQMTVGIDAIPTSLTILFERYLGQAAERIAELAPRTRRYYGQDVKVALSEIGNIFWNKNERTLEMSELRRQLNDESRTWDESIVRALEQEGILGRMPGPNNEDRFGVVHDALAGHLIAKNIISRRSVSEFAVWLSEPDTIDSFDYSSANGHTFGSDVFRSLAALLPTFYQEQLWRIAPAPLKARALWLAAGLDSASLDAETVEEIKSLVARRPAFVRLWQTRGIVGHPLNSEFLDALLRPMTTADRDLMWTEWLRLNADLVLKDLKRMAESWRTRSERAPSDLLRARWAMWALTSTVEVLRDEATQALYWFGRGKAGELFRLALEALPINDADVAERLIAASYGVVMANQRPVPDFELTLGEFLTGLRNALVGSSPGNPTNHWLIRQYVERMVTFALKYCRPIVPDEMSVGGKVPFAAGPYVPTIPDEDPRASEVDRSLRMNFVNYTLGGLFNDRPNYAASHKGHQLAVEYVRGMVWELGWRKERFDEVDKNLSDYWIQRRFGRTERYGKKYSWAGFYNYAGILRDYGLLPDEPLSELQIDPSFPEQPQKAPVDLPNWVEPKQKDDKRWVKDGDVSVPKEFLYRRQLGRHIGPWVAVHADLRTDRQARGREVFGILVAMLVEARDSAKLIKELKSRRFPRQVWLPEVGEDYYLFAGEIPWSPYFSERGENDEWDDLGREVRLPNGKAIQVEILSHRYAWESYHSQLNTGQGALLPTSNFSKHFGLVGIPQSFDQVLPDNKLAAISLTAPEGFKGHILYLREDLVRRYADGRRLVLGMWGERQISMYGHRFPDWYAKARQSGADVWRLVVTLDDLSISNRNIRKTQRRNNQR